MATRSTTAKPAEPKAPPPTTMVSLVPKGAVSAALQVLVHKFALADGSVVGYRSGVVNVRLSHRAGQIAIWGKEDSDAGLTVTITADGYDACNCVAGIQVKPTSMVAVPNQGMQPNPHHVYDERGAYAGGIIRMVGRGLNVLGNQVLVDRTLHFNTQAYFLEGLAGIAKRNPLAVVSGVEAKHPSETLADIIHDANADIERRAAADPEKWGWLKKTRTSDEDLERAIAKAKRGTFEFFHTGPGRMGYWVDFGSAAVLSLHSDFVRSQKFDSRKAETIAIRNALRHHPLMPSLKRSPADLRPLMENGVLVDRYVEVPVYFCNKIETEEEVDAAFKEHDEKVRQGAAVSEPDVESGHDADLEQRDDAIPPPKEQKGPDDEGDAREEPEKKEAPDEGEALRSQVLQAEKIAGEEIVKKALERFPAMGDPKQRAAADALVLIGYMNVLKGAIKKRDGGAEKASAPAKK